MRACILIVFQFRTQSTKYLQMACRFAGVKSLISDSLSRYEKFPEIVYSVFRCFRFSCSPLFGKHNTIS